MVSDSATHANSKHLATTSLSSRPASISAQAPVHFPIRQRAL